MLNVHERCSIWRPLFPAAILLSALLVSRLIISKPMNGRTGGRLVFFFNIEESDWRAGWVSVTSILLCDSAVKKSD